MHGRVNVSALRIDMRTFDRYLEKATQAESEGQPEEAIGYLRLALADEPLNARVWAFLGCLEEDCEMFSAAIESFRRALELGNTSAAVYSSIGRCANALGNLDSAEQALLKSVELEPTADRYAVLGTVQGNLDKDSIAEESFREALRLDPRNYEAMVNLAFQLRCRRQADEAIPLLRKAIKVDSTDASAFEELGVCLRMHGDAEEAERMLMVAINLDNSRVWAHLYLGEVLEAQDDLSGAEEEYHRAADLDPTFDLPHKLLGNFYKSQNRHVEAERHYRRAAELED